jgi:hypothetical protein
MYKAKYGFMTIAMLVAAWILAAGSASAQNGDQFLSRLEQDHKMVMQLLQELEQDPNMEPHHKTQLWTEVKRNLIPHARAEEETLYARMIEQGGEAKKMALRGKAEHAAARCTAKRIEMLDPRDPRWDAHIYVLREQIAHHVEEEEGEFWDMVEETFNDEELQLILQNFESLKRELRAGL